MCTGTVWEVFSTGVDFDGDGAFAGTDCDDGNAAIWQYLTGYPDRVDWGSAQLRGYGNVGHDI